MSREYFWTKTWGPPDVPEREALALSHNKTREKILSYIRPGDIVVYLTSDRKEAELHMRGRLAGAVEISDPILKVDVERLRPKKRKLPEHYRSDGRFRWPYGIAVARSWSFVEQELNNTLVPNHADMRIQGAATIHKMSPEEVKRLMSLEVIEVVSSGNSDRLPFEGSLQRPWLQKTGWRKGSNVQPGKQLYVAQIWDQFGLTFKIGSGKADDRLKELNRYRRGSLGEKMWSLKSKYEFQSTEAARAAEDYILAQGKKAGFASLDNTEFLVGITAKQLNTLVAEAIVIGHAKEPNSSSGQCSG